MQPLLEAGRWLVQVDGDCLVEHTGKPYRNHYVVLIRMRDGKIADYVSYHNPLIMMEAFGLPIRQSERTE
ncbi:PhzA/PhzB family protein [Nocardia transvalensis]|nr:PhzA/PhzB family protein [Nocardia transvalensis]